jgi:23S rRNA pseudouridine2457 synthase
MGNPERTGDKYRYFVLHKPFGVISQFSDEQGKIHLPTLASCFPFPGDVYPVGRLDADSEGILLITNDSSLNHKLLGPDSQVKKVYYAQVAGAPDETALQKWERGGLTISHKGRTHICLPAKAKLIDPPDFPERSTPVSFGGITSWIRLTLVEGKNRQVRKMTAAAGFPTLRLIRVRISGLALMGLQSGEVKEYSRNQIYRALFG